MTKRKSKPSLNPALKSFWQTKSDLRVLKGGRSSSKTWSAAGHAIYLAKTYTVKFLCVRQFQNRIHDSVYAVLLIQIARFGLEDEFEILKTSIKHKITGSEFHFYGIHRNIAEIKGFEGADICWIEEGEGLTKEQWGIIEPTLRKEGAECWLLYNPRLITDFVETFKHDPSGGVIVRHINYDENPFMSGTMLRKIDRLKKLDFEEYQHVYLGIPRSDDGRAIIKRSWVEASIDAHIKLGLEAVGAKVLGFDVADGGKDLCATLYRHGMVAEWGERWKAAEDEILVSSKRVYSKATEYGADIVYDSIGVGASAGNKFNELNKESGKSVLFSKFVAGGKVVNPDGFYLKAGRERITNKEFFSNAKSQAWWRVAELFRNTYNAVVKNEEFEQDDLISISSTMPNLGNLVTELSTPKKDYANDGRVKVESKKELDTRGVPSHNDADAFIMAFAPRKRNRRSIFSV